MAIRHQPLALAFWVVALATTAVWAQEPSAAAPPNAFPPSGTLPAKPQQPHEWLGEVREQRRAWEERRQAAKEAMDARRRWIDPWGAAQQEARQQEAERRREAFREKIEREREMFRSQAPWGTIHGRRFEEPIGRGQGAVAPPAGGAEGASPEQSGTPSPPGWDNRWYYRGY